MALPLPPPQRAQRPKLRNLRRRVHPPASPLASREQARHHEWIGAEWRSGGRGEYGGGRLVGCHASPCVGGVEEASSCVAVGGGGGAEAVAEARGSHYRLAVGGAVLPGASHPQEAGGESASVGVQPVPKEGAVEVREVFEELLLLEAVSECELAYRA
mmetsp:Transcript_14892/g.27087  ORF Transcript_14892/g.27087 Transcript_14892/m.27087 type:complete len:158 (+) Transcript_14892:382-855(+)